VQGSVLRPSATTVANRTTRVLICTMYAMRSYGRPLSSTPFQLRNRRDVSDIRYDAGSADSFGARLSLLPATPSAYFGRGRP